MKIVVAVVVGDGNLQGHYHSQFTMMGLANVILRHLRSRGQRSGPLRFDLTRSWESASQVDTCFSVAALHPIIFPLIIQIACVRAYLCVE